MGVLGVMGTAGVDAGFDAQPRLHQHDQVLQSQQRQGVGEVSQKRTRLHVSVLPVLHAVLARALPRPG